jgi:hypothetical protein
MLTEPTPASNSDGRLAFNCSACGLTLTAERRLTGVSGPCPACGVQISAPSPAPPQVTSRRQKGRIAGDSIIDHQYLDRKEAGKTLWILMLFILAIGACLAVSWFLKDSGSR